MLGHIRRQELLRPGDRVGVAVSGGIDSVALLRLLLEVRAELGIVLSVVHFNHKLRGADSDRDQEFVANLAREHAMQKVPFLLVVGDKESEAGKVNVRSRGKEKTEDMPAAEFVDKIKKLIAEKSPGL